MTSHASRYDASNTAVDSDAAEATPAEHRFSESYQRRRQALIDQYGGATHANRQASGATGTAAPSRLKWKIGAIAAAAALVVVPVSAWAVANNADFFAAAFGSDARTSVQTHEEVQGYKGGKPVVVTYPNREYVDVDVNKAEELLGAYTAMQETPVDIGDHALTILSTVRDRDTMIVHYTLERSGGVTALGWDAMSNQAKGAYHPVDQPHSWLFFSGVDAAQQAEAKEIWGATPAPEDPEKRADFERSRAALDDANFYNFAGDFTYVDPERSTEDKLYCYAYLIFDTQPEEGKPVSLLVRNGDVDEQVVDVPAKGAVPTRTLIADGVGTLEVSPLSLRFDHTGDGDIVDEGIARAHWDKYFGERFGSFETFLEGCYSEVDVDACSRIVVKYRDGGEYTVYDHIADLENTTYALGRNSRQSLWMFNRLVDPQNIESITVNDVTFS